jgi:hypothetical protein
MSTHTSEASLLNAERRQTNDMIRGSTALCAAIYQRHPHIAYGLRARQEQRK